MIDETGTVLIVGASGKDGRDSQVPGARGPSGADGVGVTGATGTPGKDGRHGRDAQIKVGTVASGDTASATIREENGFHVLDLVLPRGAAGREGIDDQSVVGPAGRDGARGEQGLPGIGKPGNIDAAIANVERVLEERLAAFRVELGLSK